MLGRALALLAPLACASCREEPETAPAAAPAPQADAASPWHDGGPYRFRDATAESGLAAFRQLSGSPEKPFLVETVGGGCALFDLDQDGDLDAYLTNGGTLGAAPGTNPSDALFWNDGRGRFTDGSTAAGIDERRWTNGVRAGDVDGDGWPDLYLTNYGRNTLYRGLGQGRFEDATEASGCGDEAWSTGATFFDFDRDGDLDLFVANYVAFDEARYLAERPTTTYQGVEVMKGPQGLPGAPDTFHVNAGGLAFVARTAELGLGDELFGFQSVAFDFDLDGWLDLFVANDSVANNLWRNLEGRRFEDVALRQGVAFSLSGRPQAGMGAALGDADGDGALDLYVTNFADDYSTFYRGEARGFFRDVTQSLGLATPTMDKLAWGTGFEDLDLDGDLELYAVNGHVYPQVDRFPLGVEYHQPVQLFERVEGRWREPPGRGGAALAQKGAGRGAASGDVDGDGDLDLLLENLDGPPRLLVNETRAGRALAVTLVGAGANRPAVGARLVLRAGGREQVRLAGLSTGFLSSSAEELVFGLGALARAEELVVTWPLGKVESFTDLAAGRVTIEEQAGAAAARVSRR
ncbi:MAG TPA: CRTAC1 family protein [Planctomycetota bacterium]